ncbi:STIV orfB116 family protein [Acidithiobacillus caldus]|jgi:hypothetical protein|uniref:DUF1874 domain-containing protein n=1 Tax=Acidithiobacillus caldus TaxID=33059 RepID=A0A1E7YKH6_9PROT|nr:DUF1874 domain-containing protein [Acidithiobacillus caldus]OFC30313.1 hypothetical protein BAE27_11995 [Acidithiobacillus caldus]OFC37337.1 hypothetical protein BAE29_11230 [Acidithiobacillus caldus]OFC39191.1 hypothetical protein BAE28_04195 [Acidithiobacillus caldus]
MTIYLFNTAILTDYGTWRLSGPVAVTAVQELLHEGFQSAIGHQTTADYLTEILQLPIPLARIDAHLQVGDRAIVYRLHERQREGHLLSLAELRSTPFSFALLERLI